MIHCEFQLKELNELLDDIRKKDQNDLSPVTYDRMGRFWSQIEQFSKLYAAFSGEAFTADRIHPHIKTILKIQEQVQHFFSHYREESALCDQIMSDHETIEDILNDAKFDLEAKPDLDTAKLMLFGAKAPISEILAGKEKLPGGAVVIFKPDIEETLDLPPNVQELFVSHCTPTVPLLKEIGSMPCLRKLTFSNCPALRDDRFRTLSTLSCLEEFTCDSQTDGSGLIFLLSASRLKRLDMRITLENLHILKYFSDLESLNLYSSALSAEGMKQVAELSHLKDLALDSAGHRIFTDESAQQLISLRNLESLTIQNCPGATNDCLEIVGKIESLRHLILRKMDVDDSGASHLLSCAKLQSLEISESHLTNRALHILKYLPALKKLVLHNSRISSEGVKVLVEFPVLKIAILSGKAFREKNDRKKAKAHGKEHGIEVRCYSDL